MKKVKSALKAHVVQRVKEESRAHKDSLVRWDQRACKVSQEYPVFLVEMAAMVPM